MIRLPFNGILRPIKTMKKLPLQQVIASLDRRISRREKDEVENAAKKRWDLALCASSERRALQNFKDFLTGKIADWPE